MNEKEHKYQKKGIRIILIVILILIILFAPGLYYIDSREMTIVSTLWIMHNFGIGWIFYLVIHPNYWFFTSGSEWLVMVTGIPMGLVLWAPSIPKFVVIYLVWRYFKGKTSFRSVAKAVILVEFAAIIIIYLWTGIMIMFNPFIEVPSLYLFLPVPIFLATVLLIVWKYPAEVQSTL
ncbi:MAG: hypothetical protein ACW98Y_21575 [Candidatus Thorarchaeota archaeon]|jgi:hypothetical protein